MGINPIGSGIGLGSFSPSFSSLVHQEETLSSNSLPQAIRPPIRSDVPGNRLYWDGKTIKLEPKPPAYVAGELLNKVWKAASSAIGSFAKGAQQKISSLFFRPASAEGCYIGILNQFPQMDSSSSSIVQTLCRDNDTEVTVYNKQLNSQGVQAIAESLAQNTALQTFSFSGTYCDTAVFATAFASALSRNAHLQNLVLNLADINPGPIIPSPITSTAASTLLQKLQCFNLSSLNIDPVDLTSDVAQVLKSTIQNTPHFPLKKFALSWRENSVPLDPQISEIFQALEQSRCITEIQPATYTQLSPNMMLTLFDTVGGSQTISTLLLWCSSPYTFNSTEKQRILDSVSANPCFLNFTNTVPNYRCFDIALEDAIRNITQNRTLCERDLECSTFVANCSSASREPNPPDGTPSSSSGEDITKKMPFRLSLSLAGGALVATGIALYGKRKGWCGRQEEQEPGAAPIRIELQPPPLPPLTQARNQDTNTSDYFKEGEP